jgi:polysaccharide pyruvyl transferase WcaK-like protein
MARIVDLASQMFELPIVLLPQGPSDVSALAKLAYLMKADARLALSKRWSDPIVVAQQARLMIAVPHHSLIFALRGGVPVLSPVMGNYYQFKNRGSMRFFGLEEYVVDISGDDKRYLHRSGQLLGRIKTEGSALRSKLLARRDLLLAESIASDRAFKNAFNSVPG